jgi:excisionase family DNA binding protein
MPTYGSDAAVDPLAALRSRATVDAVTAAEVLSTTTSSVYRWVREGRLPAIRVGSKTVRIRTADLLAILEPQ